MLYRFDRYLLGLMMMVFVVGFCTVFGLYVVIDAFTNVDGFQYGHENDPIVWLLLRMGRYYGIQAFSFFDMTAPLLAAVSLITVVALLHSKRMLYPLFSAGVSIDRIAAPLLAGVVLLLLAVMVNREVVLPRLAYALQLPLGKDAATGVEVEPVYDFATHILLSGRRLFPGQRRILQPEFVLPTELASEVVTLRASEGVYVHSDGRRPGGWVLRDVTPRYGELHLTAAGRAIILPGRTGEDIFVATDVGVDQLYRRDATFRLLSTAELMRRIRNPSTPLTSVRAQVAHLHERLTQPVLILLVGVLGGTIVLRRESRSLIANVSLAIVAVGTAYVAHMAAVQMGRTGLLPVDLAAWSPAVVVAALVAWLYPTVET
ncbi:MAG: LptF/LptG family permease [Planctomycetota bacterium]|nr:MAG: LptF/LptG family permease [Planctomycetota bacterium]